MLGSLLGHMTPISSVRRNLMIITGVAILITFFSVDTSSFGFLGIRFEAQTINYIVGLLSIFYATSLAFKSLLVVRVYFFEKQQMAIRSNEYIEREVREKIKDSRRLEYSILQVSVLGKDRWWERTAIAFEYALPIGLAYLLGFWLIWDALNSASA